MNIAATFSADGRPRPIAIFDFDTRPPLPPHGLQYVRASALAQARLQLAILGGNRRRALREIDRLAEIDRELARIAGPDQPAARTSLTGAELEAYLARQQSAIASEKLALVAGVEFPRLPERDEEPFEDTETIVVEDANVGRRLAFAGFWLAAALILLGTVLTIAIPALAASI